MQLHFGATSYPSTGSMPKGGMGNPRGGLNSLHCKAMHEHSTQLLSPVSYSSTSLCRVYFVLIYSRGVAELIEHERIALNCFLGRSCLDPRPPAAFRLDKQEVLLLVPVQVVI